MKTIKITQELHKKLLRIKAEGEFKTIDQTISHIIKWIIPEKEIKNDK